MMIRHIQSRGGGRAADGFSLVELLVVITLLSVVGGVVLSVIVTSTNIQRKNDSIVLQRTAAQVVLQRMGRDLTVADPITSASANDVTMRVYRSGKCEIHRWYLDASNNLAVDVGKYPASTTCTNASGALTATVTTVVARNVVNGGAPVFSYLKWDSTQKAQVAITSPVAASSVGSIDRVEMELRLATLSNVPIVEEEAVDLRNVEIK